MPVTARLSKLFYDRLGEEIATELVDWFNQVDATYRADLRELNELNVRRFEATLDARLEGISARIRAVEARVDSRFAEYEARANGRFEGLETRLNARIDKLAAALDARLERGLKEQTRWMFVAWASLLIPIIGLWMRG